MGTRLSGGCALLLTIKKSKLAEKVVDRLSRSRRMITEKDQSDVLTLRKKFLTFCKKERRERGADLNSCGIAPSTNQKSEDVVTATNPPAQKYWLHGGFCDFWLDTEFNPWRGRRGKIEERRRRRRAAKVRKDWR